MTPVTNAEVTKKHANLTAKGIVVADSNELAMQSSKDVPIFFCAGKCLEKL